MSRLFFALWPDETTRRAIAGLSGSLPSRVRRVPAANLHITLVFLGNVSGKQQEELVAGAGRIECPAFSLLLDRIDWWRKPRIIHAAPTDVPETLLQLVGSLRQLAVDAGISIDQRPYRPHVTLARKVRYAGNLPAPAPVRWPVDDFCLVRSETLPEGARYDVIWHRYP